MGKGLVTLNPFHSDNELMRKVTHETKLDAFYRDFLTLFCVRAGWYWEFALHFPCCVQPSSHITWQGKHYIEPGWQWTWLRTFFNVFARWIFFSELEFLLLRLQC